MRLPRNLSGTQLARLLRRFGYEPTRQTGGHIRLTSTRKGTEHHITIPNHESLKVGTLHAILSDVAAYIELSEQELLRMILER